MIIDSYKILNLTKNASVYDIKIAYKRLAKSYHPDISSSPDAEERFIEIQNAYEELIQIYRKKRVFKRKIIPEEEWYINSFSFALNDIQAEIFKREIEISDLSISDFIRRIFFVLDDDKRRFNAMTTKVMKIVNENRNESGNISKQRRKSRKIINRREY